MVDIIACFLYLIGDCGFGAAQLRIFVIVADGIAMRGERLVQGYGYLVVVIIVVSTGKAPLAVGETVTVGAQQISVDLVSVLFGTVL